MPAVPPKRYSKRKYSHPNDRNRPSAAVYGRPGPHGSNKGFEAEGDVTDRWVVVAPGAVVRLVQVVVRPPSAEVPVASGKITDQLGQAGVTGMVAGIEVQHAHGWAGGVGSLRARLRGFR
jgi:hypothetical protein